MFFNGECWYFNRETWCFYRESWCLMMNFGVILINVGINGESWCLLVFDGDLRFAVCSVMWVFCFSTCCNVSGV